MIPQKGLFILGKLLSSLLLKFVIFNFTEVLRIMTLHLLHIKVFVEHLVITINAIYIA